MGEGHVFEKTSTLLLMGETAIVWVGVFLFICKVMLHTICNTRLDDLEFGRDNASAAAVFFTYLCALFMGFSLMVFAITALSYGALNISHLLKETGNSIQDVSFAWILLATMSIGMVLCVICYISRRQDRNKNKKTA